jgi:hypothetical protein
MFRRSLAFGSIAVVLAAGACSSDDAPDTPASAASASAGPLCERIGTEALRKVIPTFQPDPPGEGESTACVRPAAGSGDFLRITIEDSAPGTEEECVNLARDSGGATWLSADQLTGVGDFACGTVATADNQGVLVTILARRAGTHVSISFGRTPGEATAVREAVVGLARTVMQRV